MLVRDCNGKIIVVSRETCDTERVYNEKLYNIRIGYTNIFNNCFENTKIYTEKNMKYNKNIKYPVSEDDE